MISLLFIGAMLVLMWVLLIQPQRRRQQKQARLLAELAVGDEVITVGGLYGRVQSLDEDAVQLEIAPQTSVRVAKTAVAARVAQDAPEPQPTLP
ncbi:MAG: preprotein translocase subunit YajC [Gaiellaceae bacterium]